jgi:hypothetical protein
MVVTIKNLNQVNPIWFSLYVCPIYDGLITIERNTMKTQNSILSVADVVDAKKGAIVAYERSTNFFGGTSFLKKLAHAAKSAYDVAHKTGAISKGALALGHPEVAATAHLLGLGGRHISKAEVHELAKRYRK